MFWPLANLVLYLDGSLPAQEGDLGETHRQSMATKAFEFIKCRDPIHGIGLEICCTFLPDSLKASFRSCFVPLRAARWRSALSYFDPDLENYVGDLEWICRPFMREIFRHCDKLFAGKHRAVAVPLLGALNFELDSISILRNATSDMLIHIKRMIVSRLKILCPVLLEVQDCQSWVVQGMDLSWEAILQLDGETANLLSRANIGLLQLIVQLWHDCHEDDIQRKVISAINGTRYPCSFEFSPRVQSGGFLEEPRQAVCFCRFVWETINYDIANLFQITADSLATLLHSEAETRFRMKQKDGSGATDETLGDILGRFFGTMRYGESEQPLPARIRYLRRAMAFVPEFIFTWLPLMYDHAKIQLDDGQRRRHAATYRHLVLLSLIVQACSLVDQFGRRDRDRVSNAFRPFEKWFFEFRDADTLGTFSEATSILLSVHRTVLESELGESLPDLYKW